VFGNEFLSKSDAISLLEIIHKSLSCSSVRDFRALMSGLGSLISYEYATSAFVRINDDSTIKSCEIVNINYPVEWLDLCSAWLALYVKENFCKIDSIVAGDFLSFKLEHWEDTYKTKRALNEFVSISEELRLRRGYMCGVKNPKTNEGSLLSILGKSLRKNIRTEIILQHLTPHFHQALSRMLTKKNGPQNICVTQREKEVLQWLKEGKSSWDISRILGISERTVNFHIYNIMEKLGAVNRPQIVAIAAHAGLLNIQ
jgi:LuxR family transcriptional regulator, quorum-sensing system regulator CviR